MIAQLEEMRRTQAEQADLMAPELYAVARPLDVLAALRDHHEIFWHDMPPGNPYGHRGYWSMLKHRDVVSISRDALTFSSERQGPLFFDKMPEQEGALISIDPPKHKRLRSFVNPSFLPAQIRELEAYAREIIGAQLSAAIDRGHAEFVYDVAAHLPTRIFCRMMNVPEKEAQKLIAWVDEISHNITNPGPHLAGVFQSISAYGNLLAESRSGHTGNDVVAAMMRAEHEDGPLSRTEFGNLFMTIATGASETMRSVLSNSVLTFCERPDLLDDIRLHPDIVDTAAEELLRITTPINFFRRTVTQDTDFRGRLFRENDVVVIWYLSANFDPDAFDAPDEIDLRRDPNRQIAFGVGEHFCLGARLARMQTRIFLEEFSRRVRRVELDGTPTRVAQPLFNVMGSLPVRFVPM
jgi:cytochrome P450